MRAFRLALAGLMMACSAKKPAAEQPLDAAEAVRPIMVYRTKQDVHDKVPVGLSADRQHIVSYPHPKDMATASPPTRLHDDHWLDHKGIGPNTGFLRLTYAEYAALSKAPSLAELETMVIDRDPLLELCDCGTRGSFADPVKELNGWLEQGRLRERCKVLK
ncbi:MAG TPA: hypothetical protein VGE21_07655 [Flavobacteriales bacterium]